MTRDIAIFSGTAHRAFAEGVCAHLGREPDPATVTRFGDGETRVQIGRSVRGVDCYVVQPTCAPANHNVMELLIVVDALRRASAGSVTAVVPYYGYARQERKAAPRTPISAALVADLMVAAGVDRVVTVDLHAPAIQGFFRCPVDNLYALPVMAPYLAERYAGAVVVSPDAGGFERAREYSKRIPGTDTAAIDKRRSGPNVSEVVRIVGSVAGRRCLVVDDMVDTAGTLVRGCEALLDAGAESVSACATHGVLSSGALERVAASRLSEVVLGDTVPLEGDAGGKVRVLTLAPLVGEAVRRISSGESVTSLFT